MRNLTWPVPLAQSARTNLFLHSTSRGRRSKPETPSDAPLNAAERRRVQLAFLEILQRKLEIRLAQVRMERQVLAGAPR